MSKERRHLRFLITSALLVGPAMGCGGAEPETNTAPFEDPTGNPMGPGASGVGMEDDPEPVGTPVMEERPTGNPVGPAPQIVPVEEEAEPAPPVEAEPAPRVERPEPQPRLNIRRPPTQMERTRPPVTPPVAPPVTTDPSGVIEPLPTMNPVAHPPRSPSE